MKERNKLLIALQDMLYDTVEEKVGYFEYRNCIEFNKEEITGALKSVGIKLSSVDPTDA